MRYLPSLLALGTLAAGCDAQFSPDYTGESLLTIVGSVEIANGPKGKLVPALAYMNQSRGEVSIQEVAVRGQFPSDFRLDVFEPPPEDAFTNLTHQKSGEPRMAMSFISAVQEEHEDTLRQATSTTFTHFSCEADTCDQPCGGKGCLVGRFDYCVDEDPDVPCYSEEMYCPTFDSNQEDCELIPVSEGDRALKDSPWDSFAGFSQNYLVLFLRERAAPGSVTAAMLGGENGVPRGYGLYALHAPSAEERAAKEECTARAEVHAARAWNEEFEANLATLNFESVCFPTGAAPMAGPPLPGMASAPGDLGAEPTDFAAPFCGSNIDAQDQLDAALEARERHIEAAQLELGCAILDFKLERVKNPARESVSVVIGPEVQPIFLRE